MNWSSHQVLEKSTVLLLIGILITVAIGGIVEIAPLYWLSSTIEKVQGMRPYTPLELAGRDIYIREGCYVCHSQMIRSLRDEVERYGHYSLAAESMYDHPFRWGSQAAGPDLARVGGIFRRMARGACEEPARHRAESIVPGYPHLARTLLDYQDIADRLRANWAVGVPYTNEMIDNAKADLERQLDPAAEGVKDFLARYPKAQVRQFDDDPSTISELDAVIAYLQMLGTLVDFAKFDAAGPNLR